MTNFMLEQIQNALISQNISNIQDISKQQIDDKQLTQLKKYSVEELEIKEDKEKEDIADNNQSQIPSFLSKSKLFLDQSKFRFNKQSLLHQSQNNNTSMQNTVDFVSQKVETKDNQSQYLQIINEHEFSKQSSINQSLNLNLRINEKEKSIAIYNSSQNKSFPQQRNDEITDISMNQKEGKQIKAQTQKLDRNYLSVITQKIQDKALFKNVQQQLFGLRCFWKKKQHQDSALSTKNQKNIFDSVNKEIDILQLYKDIFILKKAIMILINQDQLATLQLLGCSKDFLDQDCNKLINNKLDDSFTHFEKSYAITQSDQLQNIYIQEFLKRCSSTQRLSKIDSRILNSLLKKK
ncbi:hypothetical protein ABPG74_003804 [Tetrahymena malaccensis]